MRFCTWRSIRMWQRNRDIFFKLWHSEATGFVVEPVIILLTMGLGLGSYVGLIGGRDYMEFITPGIVASYAMYSATFEGTYGAWVRMEYQRTYDAILATPLTAEDIIGGEVLWGATRSALTGVSILALATVFHLVHSWWALLVPVVAFVEGMLFTALALIFTSYIPTMYAFNYYFTLFITPMFFFSGVFFPLSSFPPLVQTLSWIAPLTSVVRLTRALVTGEFEWGTLPALAVVVVLTAVFFIISLVTMKRRLVV